jgi:hypothetical protein
MLDATVYVHRVFSGHVYVNRHNIMSGTTTGPG